MKKYLLIILTAVFTALAVTAATTAKVKFATKNHDFGYVRENGGAVTCYFEFENIGTEPLIVISARASCGCTKPTYPKKPVGPGEKAKIGVTYNPANRPGAFDKTVTIRTNAGTSYLRVKGTVIP